MTHIYQMIENINIFVRQLSLLLHIAQIWVFNMNIFLFGQGPKNFAMYTENVYSKT